MGSTVRHKKAKKLDVRCKKISTISREITFSKKKITVSSRVTKVRTFSYRAITLLWPSSLCSEIYSPLLGLNTLFLHSTIYHFSVKFPPPETKIIKKDIQKKKIELIWFVSDLFIFKGADNCLHLFLHVFCHSGRRRKGNWKWQIAKIGNEYITTFFC